MAKRPLEQLMVDVDSLFTLPDVYLKVKQVIDDPDSGLADLACVVSLDPALSARFLKIANSAMYGLQHHISSISHAVNLIGSRVIHDIVLATSVAELFEGMHNSDMDVESFWEESLRMAVASRAASRVLSAENNDRLFMHGLLADIGHLVIYQKLPGLAVQARERAINSCRPVHLIEMEMFGLDHAKVGGALADLWQLPPDIADTIRYQYRPEGQPELAQDIAILNIARYACFAHRDGLTTLHPSVMRSLEVTQEELDDIRVIAEDLMDEARSILALKTRAAA